MFGLTDVQMVNKALWRAGQAYDAAVTDVSGLDISKWGQWAALEYQSTRNEELMANEWKFAIKRAALPLAMIQQTASWFANSNIMTVGSTAGLFAGWTITSALGQNLPPTGIPVGTVIASIVSATQITISNNATANGSGTVFFQVINNTGYWYTYVVPSDCLHTCFLYAILPQWVFTYPRKYLHIVMTPYINEGYYYTDLDPTNGNPYAKYVMELPLGTVYYDALFCDAVVIRLASKLLPSATARVDGVAAPYQQEYAALLTRAVGKNALDKEDDLPDSGQTWWSDRGPYTGDWGGPP